MRKNIFYFESLKRFDYISIAVYILISLILLACCYKAPLEANQTLVFAYGFGTVMLLYGFGYRSLRNLTVYFVWIGIALIHLFIYFQLKDISGLKMKNGHAAIGLRNTLPMLILFQILRFVNIKIQNQELVAPSWGSSTDILDGRRVNFMDFISFVIYIVVFIILSFKI
ncbi:MAG: hypothetical protein JNM21_14175 [Taibaiella sp.]|nr:hypothetical protein [Taibaiella sp.]